jgi:hypothetical protein
MFVGGFFTIDDRLITVSVAGRKRTTKLGAHPPLAMAESVALDLLRDKATGGAAIVPERNASWIEAITSRLHIDSKSVANVQS